MLRKLNSVVSSGLISFVLYGSFAFLAFTYLRNERGTLTTTGIALTVTVHYLVALFCGYWAGYKAEEDGWFFGMLGYGLWYALYRLLYVRMLEVHATLPFSLPIKLVAFLPVFALLLFSGVMGEQKAHIEKREGKTQQVFYPIAKRLLDIIVSALGLLILTPLLFLIALLIKLASPGPVFFHQERIGLFGRPFNLIKFRTMYIGAETVRNDRPAPRGVNGTSQLPSDPRVFPLGRVLRVMSLDEVPQLINVLIGDMSLIGPRPWVPSEVAEIEETDLERLKVRPGLTGWAQVNGRGDLPVKERLEMDLDYITRQSFSFDLYILFRSLGVVLHRRGAY